VGAKSDLFSATLEPVAAEQLRSLLEQVGLCTFVFAADTIVYDGLGQRYASYLRTWSERMVCVNRVTSTSGWSTLEPISAVVAIGEKSDVDAVRTGLLSAAEAPAKRLQTATFPLRAPGKTHAWALIVRCADIDKGTATAWLANYHRVPLDQVVAVGDWINDVPMFRVVGKSFVMGQAPAEVREAATYVLAAHTSIGGGIREAAERAGLL
jgi:hydroxymethylpyrimidine pyrophosphatase-like HAD family hydrolase